MADNTDEWVTTIYESCAAVVESLQDKEEDLTSEEQGLNNLCETVVYLYTELYEDPLYISGMDNVESTRVLH